MTKEEKQKKKGILNYNLSDFDYDGPIKEEQYKEDEQNYEIDYDADDDYDSNP